MPSLTITPDISAETWLGAAGCARGSQTCSGTRPAFEPKPTSARTKTAFRVAGARDPAPARRASNDHEPAPPLPSRKKAASRAARPRCAMTMYQRPPLMLSGRSCSVMTRKPDATAMSSQASTNVRTLEAQTTRLSASRNAPDWSADHRAE